VLFGVVMALGLIPVVGGSLSELASPLMVAGFMAAYRALDSGQDLELPHFLAGVRGPAIPLMTIGAVQLLGTLLIGQIMQSMGFDPQALMTAAQSQKDPAEMQAILNQAMPALLTGLVLFTPLIMATWFAPALILFGGARPATALGVSLKAVAKNWAAMLENILARPAAVRRRAGADAARPLGGDAGAVRLAVCLVSGDLRGVGGRGSAGSGGRQLGVSQRQPLGAGFAEFHLHPRVSARVLRSR
jgi:hypothetical protein